MFLQIEINHVIYKKNSKSQFFVIYKILETHSVFLSHWTHIFTVV